MFAFFGRLLHRAANFARNGSDAWRARSRAVRGRSSERLSALPVVLASFDVLAGDQLTGMRSSAGLFAYPGARVSLRPSPVPAGLADVPMLRRLHERMPQAHDAGLVIAFVLIMGLFLMLADQRAREGERTTRTDAAATRLPEYVREDAVTGRSMDRLAFAPQFPEFPSGSHAATGSGPPMPFGAQGALVLRGLPSGTSLSAGLALADGWVLAPGDLNRLEMSLPQVAPGPIGMDVEVIGADGVSRGVLAMTLLRQPGPPENDDAGVGAPAASDAAQIHTGAIAGPRAAGPVLMAGPQRAKRRAAAAKVKSYERRERRSYRADRAPTRARPARQRMQPVPAFMLGNATRLPPSLYTPEGLAPRGPDGPR